MNSEIKGEKYYPKFDKTFKLVEKPNTSANILV